MDDKAGASYTRKAIEEDLADKKLRIELEGIWDEDLAPDRGAAGVQGKVRPQPNGVQHHGAQNLGDSQVGAKVGRDSFSACAEGRPAGPVSHAMVESHPMEFDIGGSSDPDLKESSRVLEGKIKFLEEKLARNDEEFVCAQRVVREFQTETRGQFAAAHSNNVCLMDELKKAELTMTKWRSEVGSHVGIG